MRHVFPALLLLLLLCASLRLGGEVYQNRRLVRGDWQEDWVAGMTPVNQLWQEAYDADGPVRDYYASSAGDWSLGIQEDWVRGSDWGGGIGGILYSQPEYGNATTAKYYNYDGRGDVVALTSNVGNITYAAAYNAYGQHATVTSGNVTTTGTQEVGTDTDLFRLTTKEEDPTGLSYQINRYVSLTDNNWLSRDPLGLVNGPNPYTYVGQNNWTKFDPDGREALTLGAGALALGDAIPEPAEPVFWVLTGLTVIGGGAVVVHNVENSAPAPAPTTAAPPISNSTPPSGGPVQKQPTTTPGQTTPAIPNSTGGTTAAPLPNATPGGSPTPLPITTPPQQTAPEASQQGTVLQAQGNAASGSTSGQAALGAPTQQQPQQQQQAGPSQKMTPDQQALKDLVDEAGNGGRKPLSTANGNTVSQWAQEVQYPGFRASPGDVSSPSNWPGGGGQPHIHLPGVGSGHIPVEPGVTPVTP